MNRSPLQRAAEERAEYAYHLLRVATERFQTLPGGLTPEQRGQAEHQARQTFALESLVLSSPEARDTLVPEQRLEEALREVRQRYADQDTFQADLAENGLDEQTLRRALQRELIFDAVMQRVGAGGEAITEVDERLFYEFHQERFASPERRTVRHILVTINDDFAENRRDAALARIERIAAELGGRPDDFGALARRHSECPTAMEDGRLGTVARGTLFPALDTALFALRAGEISAILESELGFHLLWCEAVEPSVAVTFEQARPKIHAALDARRRHERQKTWIARLRKRDSALA